MAEVKEGRGGKATGAKSAAKTARAEAPATTQPAPPPKAPAATPAPVAAAPVDNLREREIKAMEANGAGILTVMFAFAEMAEENKRLPMMVQAAKVFLIAFLFIAPVMLLWQQVF